MLDKRPRFLIFDLQMTIPKDHAEVDACPACCCHNSKPWRIKDGYNVLECASCGFRFTYQLPSEQFLKDYYAGLYCQDDGTFKPKGGALRRLKYSAFSKYLKYLIARNSQGGGGKVRIVELGCGQGDLLKAFKSDPEIEILGMDYAAGPVEHLRSLGYRAHLGGLSEAPVSSGQLSAVVMLHVLEHVREPEVVLRKAFDLLRKGGVLYAVCPCSAHIKATLAGENWKYLGPPGHLWYFTPKSLRVFAERIGFKVQRCSNIYHRAHVTIVAVK